MTPSLYDSRLEAYQRQIEESLDTYLLRAEKSVPPELSRAMHYACEAGGKRIRPVLAMEFCRNSAAETPKTHSLCLGVGNDPFVFIGSRRSAVYG